MQNLKNCIFNVICTNFPSKRRTYRERFLFFFWFHKINISHQVSSRHESSSHESHFHRGEHLIIDVFAQFWLFVCCFLLFVWSLVWPQKLVGEMWKCCLEEGQKRRNGPFAQKKWDCNFSPHKNVGVFSLCRPSHKKLNQTTTQKIHQCEMDLVRIFRGRETILCTIPSTILTWQFNGKLIEIWFSWKHIESINILLLEVFVIFPTICAPAIDKMMKDDLFRVKPPNEMESEWERESKAKQKKKKWDWKQKWNQKGSAKA